MKKSMLLFGLMTLGAIQAPLYAADGRPEVSEGNVPPGEVILRSGQEGEGVVIEEYRRAGVVYKVKVTPKKGRPYYLVDSDGDGSLDLMQFILLGW